MARVEDNAENERICQRECGRCPSYPGVQGEWLFCARVKSKGKVERKGCNCPECDVWINVGLSGMYYCAQGAAQ
ncbi:MAG: DUF2769 domain-containing protein [bacterium]